MRRWLPFLIILVVALAIVGGGWALYRSKMATPPKTAAAQTQATPPLAPDWLHVRGPANAPITLEIYGDFQCPACATASAVLDKVERIYGSKLRIIFYQFPLQMHPHAMEAAMAAEAAAVQGHFWEMHDKLYQNQTAWSDATRVGPLFDGYAQAIGLDIARFDVDRHADDLQERIRLQANSGDSRGVKNTPTIFINGEHIHGFYSEKSLRYVIDADLAASKKK